MENKYLYENYNFWQKIIIWGFFTISCITILVGILGILNLPEGIKELTKLVFFIENEELKQNHYFYIGYSLASFSPTILLLGASGCIIYTKYQNNFFKMFSFFLVEEKSNDSIGITTTIAIFLEIATFIIGVFYNYYNMKLDFLMLILEIYFMMEVANPRKKLL